ncbi:MAG: type II secretion system protein [Chloroflexi bacterium]|nr:type II secretion system protein [Chloroflexota bacterium]
MNKRRQQVAFPAFGPARNGERGLTLIEILVALGILAAVAVIFLIGMSTSSKAVMVSQESVTADSLAKSQMERIKSWAYDAGNNPPNYEAAKLTDIPDGYDITISAARLDPKGDGTDNDDGLQEITVTVTHDGEPVFTLVGYKVKP